MQITHEQTKAVERGEAVPVTVGETECVVLRRDVYEYVREALDDWDPRFMRRQMAEMMGEDWADPAMDIYDR